MKSGWRKVGRVYFPSGGRHPKLASHASNPLAVHIAGDAYRVFYSARDEANRSSVGAVDLNLATGKILTDHPEPFFEFAPGGFFSDGISIGCVYNLPDGRRLLLFMGWKTLPEGRWRGEIGVLDLSPDLTLSLASDAPLLGVGGDDPISVSYPWVERDADGSYTMWYGSTHDWGAAEREMTHLLHRATSENGWTWRRRGPCLTCPSSVASAFSRPTVLRDRDGLMHMWFSFRGGQGGSYRIGHAVSERGDDWRLALGECCLDTSEMGWDSEMTAYPFVLRHGGAAYMLYNGNGYGKTGFGLAVMEDF